MHTYKVDDRVRVLEPIDSGHRLVPGSMAIVTGPGPSRYSLWVRGTSRTHGREVFQAVYPEELAPMPFVGQVLDPHKAEDLDVLRKLPPNSVLVEQRDDTWVQAAQVRWYRDDPEWEDHYLTWTGSEWTDPVDSWPRDYWTKLVIAWLPEVAE